MNVARVNDDRIAFWCPGCNDLHMVPVHPRVEGWAWNGSLEHPTLTPSILCFSHGTLIDNDKPAGPDNYTTTPTCHSFVTEGRIQFLSDSTHELSNQTVPLGPIPADLFEE
jgi:hypothetical protein